MPDTEKIHKSLLEHSIDKEIIEQIFEGCETKPYKLKKDEKAAVIIKVINRLDELISAEQGAEIMDWCACCKGDTRDKEVKRFAKENKEKSLSARIEGLKKVQNMGNPTLHEEGTISAEIIWLDNGEYRCPCPKFNGLKLKEPVSATYCHCCAGHFRYHYQNALGVKLSTKEIYSSVLSTMGKKPCKFIYEIMKE